jgi:hypothetical protein
MAAPCRSTGLPNVAAAPRRIGPKKASAASSRTKDRTNAEARKWAADGTGGVGAAVVPVPRPSSDPANILVHGGDTALPPGIGEGSVSLLDSGERGGGHPAVRCPSGANGGEDGRARRVAPQARKQLLLTLWVRVPR